MGFTPLNTMLTGGIPIGQMVTIGAFCNRPEERHYSSSIAMALAQRAIAQGKKVVFLTPEIMTDVEYQTDVAEKFRSLGVPRAVQRRAAEDAERLLERNELWKRYLKTR
jgi:hypothetical protein